MKTLNILWGSLFLFVIFLPLSSCRNSASSPKSEFVLGTICTVNLFEQGKPAFYSQVFGRFRELEDIFSANREGTDLDTINQYAGIEPVKVRPELIEVLEIAMEFAGKSGGFFDPSVGPLVKLWGIGSDNPRIPEEEELKKALNLIDYRNIEIDKTEGTVFLKQEKMSLDLGAIAKGYAADEISKILGKEGIKRAIIDLGGNVLALGQRKTSKIFGKNKDDEENFWRIGIQDPLETRGAYIGIVKVKNKSVVTSGIYERFFEEGGKRYHHILSTESGFPVENGLVSVTIITEKSIIADALSTAVFALGWEKGCDLLASVEGAEGIFVFEDKTVRLTPGINDYFMLISPDYNK